MVAPALVIIRYALTIVVLLVQNCAPQLPFDRDPMHIVLGSHQSANSKVFCFQADGWCDNTYGCFYPNGTYCDPRCNIFGICCAPQQPDNYRMALLLTNANYNGYELAFDPQERLKMTTGRVVFLVGPGYRSDKVDKLFRTTKKLWVTRQWDVIHVTYDVSWKSLEQIDANARIVGALIERMIEIMGVATRPHEKVQQNRCVGFSLGAHICGEAGKRSKLKGNVIQTCEGLDPQGPFYSQCDPEIKLDRSDCECVNITPIDYLVAFSSGDKVDREIHCNSIRAIELYNTQLAGFCNFPSHQCTQCGTGSWPLSPPGPVCEVGTLMKDIWFPPYTVCQRDEDNYNYYVSTGKKPPFCPLFVFPSKSDLLRHD